MTFPLAVSFTLDSLPFLDGSHFYTLFHSKILHILRIFFLSPQLPARYKCHFIPVPTPFSPPSLPPFSPGFTPPACPLPLLFFFLSLTVTTECHETSTRPNVPKNVRSSWKHVQFAYPILIVFFLQREDTNNR